jgi:hypothetical protein
LCFAASSFILFKSFTWEWKDRYRPIFMSTTDHHLIQWSSQILCTKNNLWSDFWDQRMP